jgi:hypothetical protein
MTKRALLLLLVSCGGSGSKGAIDAAPATIDASSPTGDALPTGAISFFRAAACPAGWTPYQPLAGRFLVGAPSTAGAAIGVSQGTPLTSGEDRPHIHAASMTTMMLGDVSYVGASGGGNTGVGTSGDTPATITVAAASAALPYIQLLACKKTAAPASSTSLPHGAIAFFESASCPAGFGPVAGADGRWIVAAAPGATPGAEFGGPAMTDATTPAHTHAVSGTASFPSHGIALASGCCASGYAAAGDVAYAGTAPPADVSLPFVQLRACAVQ